MAEDHTQVRRFTLLSSAIAAVVASSLLAGHSSMPANSFDLDTASQSTVTPTPTNWWAEAEIRGVVVDAASKAEPVEGARVYVHYDQFPCDWSTTTDADGRFTRRCYDIFSFPIHWVSVHIVAGGYESWSDRVALGSSDVRAELVPMAESPTPTPDDLMRYVLTSGTVRSALSGEPIAGTRIRTEGYGTCLSPVWSDHAGYYEVVCPVANFLTGLTFSASAPGYRDWERLVHGPALGAALDIDLEPARRIFLPKATTGQH